MTRRKMRNDRRIEYIIAVIAIAVVIIAINGGFNIIPKIPDIISNNVSASVTEDSSSGTNISDSDNTSTEFHVYNSKSDAISALNSLTIADSDGSEYTRADFGGWKSSDGFNTRVEVLITQASTYTLDSKNRVDSGTWYLQYTGDTVSYSSREDISKNLQIDHIVPVAYANAHGAASWDEDKKQEFYTDYGVDSGQSNGDNGTDDYKDVGNLIVSDSRSNIQKSDSGPSEWLPSNKSFDLMYCEKWVSICSNYGISISEADYQTILNVFNGAE